MSEIQDLKNYVLALDKKINDMMILIHRICEADNKLSEITTLIHNQTFDRAKQNSVLFETIYPDFARRLCKLEDVLRDFNRKETDREILLGKSVKDVGLLPRTYNCLLAEDIQTIGDLLKWSPSELLRTPNLGKKSLMDIKFILDKFNLKLNEKGER